MRALNYSSNNNEIWLVWILVTGISWVVGLFVASVFTQSVLASFPFGSGLPLGLVAWGALVGLIRWEFLQLEVEKVGVWLLATMVGWAIGFLVTLLLARFVNLMTVSLLGGVLGGMVFGYAQWMVMIPKVRGRSDWFWMTIVSWTTALTLGSVAGRKAQLLTISPDFEDVGSSGMLGWVFIVLMGGIFLVLFFPKQDNPPFSKREWM